MTDKERTFGVISKRGSAVFSGTEAQIADDILAFFDNIEEYAIGVVPANAPKKEMESMCTCMDNAGDNPNCLWCQTRPKKSA